MIPINKPILGREEEENVLSVLRSGNLTGRVSESGMVMEFERLFSSFLGVKYAVAVSSGTAALHASLLAIDVRPGDEVIVPSFTFSATCNVVLHVGAKPVFVDIDLDTYTMNPDEVKKTLTPKTKAIIPVHLYGHPADMKPIMEVAEEEKIYVIEDAAQAHGAEYNGVKVGGIGHLGCFSFYPTKIITTGEGGMVATNDEELAEKIRMIRNQGERGDYVTTLLGHNWRLPEMNAAIGVAQMRRINEFLAKRRRNANRLTELLREVKELVLPFEKGKARHAWNIYTVRLRDERVRRDDVVSFLRKRGVGATVYYPVPVHRTKLYIERGYSNVFLPGTELASKTVFSLPVHPSMTEEDVETVASAVKQSLGASALSP
ncbi:MAG: DegT/DnrJ/EryC1/StrS family aminotransferase [Candidatus Jordarchaeales archaeon]|nr:DegT/DnrJ/EryC1/StrS family aminotransferase [Candidatus Jordarchaeia archaeon]